MDPVKLDDIIKLPNTENIIRLIIYLNDDDSLNEDNILSTITEEDIRKNMMTLYDGNIVI